MNTTQQHLLIKEIREDMLILKNGGGALILQVSAVNFGLLSEREQIAIISSFAQMLNSLSFSIQIVIYSERLNISSYLKILDQAQKAQSNPLLTKMVASYRQFIQTTIKENDVLDKKFFIVIPLYSLELGITASETSLKEKIKTVLLPRRDQIVRQLSRVGLQATQLSSQKLIQLFYDMYNGQFVENINLLTNSAGKIEVNLKQPQPEQLKTTQNISIPESQINRNSDLSGTPSISESFRSKNHPFVVEELNEKV